jgi:16S rRNA (cytidine1402-2'-O)-methyltransferase
LERHLAEKYSLVLYESKYRIKDTLKFIRETAPGRIVCVGRELTKKFEELARGKIEDVEEMISSRQTQKGEFVIVCSGSKN